MNTADRQQLEMKLAELQEELSIKNGILQAEDNAVQRQLVFETLIADFSAQLIRLPITGFEASLDPWLKRFAESLGVDWVSFMIFSEDKRQIQFLRTHIVPGVLSIPVDYQPKDIPCVDKVLLRNEVIHWEHIPDDLPSDLNPEEVDFIRAGAKSFLAIPLVEGTTVVGAGIFATFQQEKQWSEDMIRRLRFLGEIIAGSFMRKRVQESLMTEMDRRRRLEERNTAVLNSAGLGFWVIDMQGRIQEVNDAYCQLVGYRRDEILSMRVYDLDLDLSPGEIDLFRDSVRDGGTHSHEARHRCKDGSIVELEVSSALMPLGKDIFTFFRDITDKKRQEREVAQQLGFESLLSEFSTSLSHVDTESLDSELKKWLERIGVFLEIDFCTVGEYLENHTLFRIREAYIAPGLPDVVIDSAPHPSIGLFDYLRRFGIIKWERIPEDVPKEFDFAKTRILKEGTKSLLVVALESGGSVLGNIVFASIHHQRRWSPDIIRRLRLMADIITNALHRTRSEQAMAERLTFETIIAEFSAALIRLPKGGLSQALGWWLKRFGDFLGVDRCIVTQYLEAGTKLRVIQSYSTPGLPPIPPDLRPRPVTGFEKFLQRGEILKFERMPDDLPDDEELRTSHVVQEGTTAFLAIPLEAGSEIIGVLIFSAYEEKRWPDDIVQRLLLVAQIISNALIRETTYQAAEQRYEFERLVSGFSAALMEQPPEELDDVISRWLEKIAGYLQVDRVSVAEFFEGKTQIRLIHGYTNPLVRTPQSSGSLKANMVFMEPLTRGEVLIIPRVPEDLPGGIDPNELRIVQDGTKSFLAVPLKAKHAVMGTLSFGTIFQERIWQEDQIGQIKLIGEVIAGALQRKQIHETLLIEMERRSRVEERNTTILQSTMVGFWITDYQGGIVEVNDAFCRLVGYSREELLAMSIDDLDVDLDTEARQKRRQALMELGSAHLEVRFQCKDGSLVDLEISINLFPAEKRAICFFKDVTAIKKAHQAIKEQLDFEMLISEFSADLIRPPAGGLAETLAPWLKRLAEFLGVDRCMVGQYSRDMTMVRKIKSYAAPGLSLIPPPDGGSFPAIGFQDLFQHGGLIAFENLPGGISEDMVPLMAPIVQDGTQSLFALPLESGETIIGILVFGAIKQKRSWPEETVRQLRLVSQMIANSLVREEAATELENRLQYEELLSGCSAELINLPTTDLKKDLEPWLKRFVEFIGIDYINVSEMDTDRRHFLLVDHYSVPGVSLPPIGFRSKPPGLIMERLLQGKVVKFDRIPDDIPGDVDTSHWASVKDGTKSLLSIPLMTQGIVIGAIVFGSFRSYTPWSGEHLRQLQLLSEIIANFLSRRRAERDLGEQLHFEALISDFSATLINLPVEDLIGELGKWLQRFTELLDVDRGHIVEYTDDKKYYRRIQSYSVPPLSPLPIDGKPRPLYDYLKKLHEGGSIVWERIPDDLPEDIDPKENWFVQSGVKSMMMLPLQAGGLVIGSFMFASYREPKKWSHDIIRRLRLVGEIMANALLRSRAEIQLSSYKDHLEELVDDRTQELRAAQEDLVRNERLATLGKLTATVSHELRNPLGTIRSSLYSINQRLEGPDIRVRKAIDRAERGITRCDKIVDELLGYARAPQLDLEATPIDQWLGDLLDDESISEGITIIKALKSNGLVKLDRERFRRCIINLLTNGAHAIEQGALQPGEGLLTVCTSSIEDRVEITIQDNGVGIDSSELEKIFEPLYSTKNFGVGLGIPIAKQVVEQHKGSMNFQSVPGKGTLVTVYLPSIPTEAPNGHP